MYDRPRIRQGALTRNALKSLDKERAEKPCGAAEVSDDEEMERAFRVKRRVAIIAGSLIIIGKLLTNQTRTADQTPRFAVLAQRVFKEIGM